MIWPSCFFNFFRGAPEPHHIEPFPLTLCWKWAGTCKLQVDSDGIESARFQNLSDASSVVANIFTLKMSSSESVPEDQLPAAAQGTEQPEVTLATFTEEQLQVLYPVWSCLPFQATQLNFCDFFTAFCSRCEIVPILTRTTATLFSASSFLMRPSPNTR